MATNPIDPHFSSKAAPLRRSQRVCLRLPIVVLCEGPGTNVASEETSTLIVSAHGALLELSLTAEAGQRLVVKNKQTLEEMACRVVTASYEETGKREVGVEFEGINPRFWRIAFPPADWTSRSPYAKAPTAPSQVVRMPFRKSTAALPVDEKTLANR